MAADLKWTVQRQYNQKSGAVTWVGRRGDEWLRMSGRFTTIRRFRTVSGAQKACDKANATPGVSASIPQSLPTQADGATRPDAKEKPDAV